MKIKQTLKILSHLKWLFLVWMIVLIIQVFLSVPNIEISQIGAAIFLSGIFMGLESLGDSYSLSEREKKFYSQKKIVKIQGSIITTGAILLFIISLFFLSLKFLFPQMDAELLNDFSDLAYDCLAMMLGFLCLLKQIRDKELAYKSLDI